MKQNELYACPVGEEGMGALAFVPVLRKALCAANILNLSY
jgi:hypothetical protein